MARQLSLAVSLRDDATIDNFWAPGDGSNAQILQLIAGDQPPLWSDPVLLVWGSGGVGKTHLLTAACHRAREVGLPAYYLSLSDVLDFKADAMLDSLEHQYLVALDDLNLAAGNSHWELALFDFYNRCQAVGTRLLLSAAQAPALMDIRLADLRSRLAASLVFHLPACSDQDKLAILRFRAGRLGLELATDVALYIMQRYSRDLHELMALLARIDRISLERQRRVTIPLVRELIGPA